MRDFDEYDDPNGALLRRVERDHEIEPRTPFVLPPRRKQFRYWTGLSFRPVKHQPEATVEIRRAA